MTATNHALTGAVIAVTLKNPLLAIPLAFLSHFVLDVVPHYNPVGINRENFKNYSDSWARKLKSKSFIAIFCVDMLLFAYFVLSLPFLVPEGVSPWTVFASEIAAASPDFVGGLQFLSSRFTKRKAKKNWFARFHVDFLQWSESPKGIYVEIAYFILIGTVLFQLMTP